MRATDLKQLAAYNAWANARLYAAALALPDHTYRQPVGVFFGSLHGTLNHLLVADRIWLKRITGAGEAPNRLDAILYDDRVSLARARLDEDARLIGFAETATDEILAAPLHYATLRGDRFDDPLGAVLTHVFNHQTHHRGQAHACLSILAEAEPPSLDLILFRRGGVAPDLAGLLAG